LLWRKERVGDREAKIPYAVEGYKASSTNPRAWTSYSRALRAFQEAGGHYDGLGFVFVKGGGLVGVDLDDCLSKDVVKPWATGVVERFFDSYMEISPSGAGLKIWALGELPANVPGVKVGDGSIEMYDHARYFTVTGRAFRGAPLQVENHADDLLLLCRHLTTQKQNRKGWPLQPLDGGRIPYGRQHSTLVSIAGTLRARRVCDEAILACLVAVNDHQCERPGTPDAISKIVKSTRVWGVR
jgi:hypothetical protein